MTFIEAIQSGFYKYADFSGRAVRSEYWYWVLFVFLGSLILDFIDIALGTMVLNPIFSLATLIPNIAVAARRLHDMDFSGWWQLIAFTVIGIPVLIVWFCLKGTEGPNRFGTNIYQDAASAPAA